MTMTMTEIEEQSPEIPEFGGGRWAMYSVVCCWWTSFPDDLGDTSNFSRPALKPEIEQFLKDLPGLPCCPHCGSVLMQTPLTAFLAVAQDNPKRYGPGGLQTFVEAHSRNSAGCRRRWDQYPLTPLRFA